MNQANRSAPPVPSFIAAEENQATEPASAETSEFQQQGSPINVERVDRRINESLRKQIVEIITRNPDLALSVLRGWKDR